MPAKPLLELSTLEPERRFIRIDGKRYDIRTPDDMGLAQIALQARLEARARDLTSGEQSEVVAEEAAEMLRSAVKLVVMAPAEVVDRLRDVQCFEILESFTRTVQAPALNRKERRQRRSTSAKSSPASAVSTAPTTG